VELKRSVRRLNPDGSVEVLKGFSQLRMGDRFQVTDDEEFIDSAIIWSAKSNPRPLPDNPEVLSITCEQEQSSFDTSDS
jgi:hypothetical protein